MSPVYGAEQIIGVLVQRLVNTLRPLGSFEIILVDDRSVDDGWRQIVKECARHPEVRGIRLSRNCGQQAAIAAGLAESAGDFVVVMDCDLQDDPAHIPDLLEAAQAGYDVVLTVHPARRHGWLRNLGARMYLRVVALLTGDATDVVGRGSYSLLTRKVVDAFNQIGDMHAHYLANLKYLGFERTQIEVSHSERFEGTSSYTWRKLVRHAVHGVVSNSARLLDAIVALGVSLFVLSLVGVVYLLVSYFARGALAGYTSLMVVFVFTSGIVLLSIGIVGMYVAQIFDQGRDRPRYFIDNRVGPTVGDDDN